LLGRRRGGGIATKAFLTSELFHYQKDGSTNLFHVGASHVQDVSKAHLELLGIQIFHTKATVVQESHGVDDHLALKECLAGLNIARVVGFHRLFFMHHPLQKALERRAFHKIGFVKGVKAVVFFFTKSSFF